MKKKRSAKSLIFPAINAVIMISVIVITLYPFWNQVILSFAKREYLYAVDAQWYPKSFDFSSYKVLLHYKDIWVGYLNTIIRTVVGTVLSLIVTALIAYPLTKPDLPFRKGITVLIMFTMLFSGGLIPTFLTVKNLGLYNTVWAIALPGAISTWNLIIMRTFFMGLPAELEESAQLDGANDFTIFARIILPLSKASIATIALFYGVGHWNNWFSGMIYFKNSKSYPLQTILRSIVINSEVSDEITVDEVINSISAEGIKYSTLVVSMVPMMAVYPFIQKYFVKGVMIGSLKG